MNTNVSEIAPDEQICLLNKLKNLLEEQIQIIHQGNANNDRIDDFNRQTESIVEKIVESGILEIEELNHQRDQLKKLYNILNLAVIAQRDETTRNIKHIRRGKKTIDVYQSNM
jgi:hypothetical protein